MFVFVCVCACVYFFRYYAICCQPLVYRHKMTPVRVAVMLSGCWLIPTFISFLPIMQSWNAIGIEDIVSPQLLRPEIKERAESDTEKSWKKQLLVHVLFISKDGGDSSVRVNAALICPS